MAGTYYRTVRINVDRGLIDRIGTKALTLTMDAMVLDAQVNFDQRLPHTARAQTGRLRESIKAIFRSNRHRELVSRARDWGRAGSYAMSQEVGSRPHLIVARRSPNLVFPWDEAPSGVFVGPVVMHPGTQGTNSMWDAAKRGPERFAIFARMLLR